MPSMALDPAQLPDDIAALKALLIGSDKRAVDAKARNRDLDAEIENLKLILAQLRHDKFGASSERTSILMDQLELQLGELVARRAQETVTEEIAAASTAANTGTPAATPKQGKRASRPTWTAVQAGLAA